MSSPATRTASKCAHGEPIPAPSAKAGRQALLAIIRERSVLPALSAFHEELGDIFQISLGAFHPIFMVGPEATRFMLVTASDKLLWRPNRDPVAELLRGGLLMADGEEHDRLRRIMNPALHRRSLTTYIDDMWRSADRIMLDWSTASGPVDMLVEMRRMALLIVMQTLFRVDMMPDLDRLFSAIIDTIRYISPGLWTVLPQAPRSGYRDSLEEVDAYLHKIIEARRKDSGGGEDLLGRMINAPGMDDDLIRDQMLTLLIAGHDTSTALLAWTLYLLGSNPQAYCRVREEIDSVVTDRPPNSDTVHRLPYLDQVLNEALRLYPPIHIGNRIAAQDLEYHGYRIPSGSRVVYSIYLTHRHKEYWRDPNRFDPSRFSAERKRTIEPYAFVPFGGGRRNCIGAAFAQVEAKVVLSRILQRYDLELVESAVRLHMGATLEPHPGVRMRVTSRS